MRLLNVFFIMVAVFFIATSFLAIFTSAVERKKKKLFYDRLVKRVEKTWTPVLVFLVLLILSTPIVAFWLESLIAGKEPLINLRHLSLGYGIVLVVAGGIGLWYYKTKVIPKKKAALQEQLREWLTKDIKVE